MFDPRKAYNCDACRDCAAAVSEAMRTYVDEICKHCAENGHVISTGKIRLARGYRDGVVFAPLGFEPDEFCGLWFVEFGLAVDGRFLVRRLDLGQARFRFAGADDVQYPGAIRENEAKRRRDDLIEAFDRRFGPDDVNIAASTATDAAQIWGRLWPLR